MRTHRHARFHLYADSVLRDAVDRAPSHVGTRRVDHLRIDARPHRFENRFAGALRGQINCASPIEIQRNPGLVCRDQSQNNMIDIATRQIMRLERIARNLDACFHSGNPIIDD